MTTPEEQDQQKLFEEQEEDLEVTTPNPPMAGQAPVPLITRNVSVQHLRLVPSTGQASCSDGSALASG